jgi:hypothetical protein
MKLAIGNWLYLSSNAKEAGEVNIAGRGGGHIGMHLYNTMMQMYRYFSTVGFISCCDRGKS